MEHLIILNKTNEIIYSSDKLKTKNDLIISTVLGIEDLCSRFLDESFLSYSFCELKIACFKTCKNETFILCCKYDEREYFRRIYSKYSQCKVLGDIDLFKTLLSEIL